MHFYAHLHMHILFYPPYNIEENELILRENNISFGNDDMKHWLLKRFVSIGYYAFVNYAKVDIQPKVDEDVAWFDFEDIPPLYSDHNQIIEKARISIKVQLSSLPIGYELLPPKFTMTELRVIYETIYGEKLDRRNFQRKVLMSDLVYKLDEVYKKKGVKSSALYSFNKDTYIKSMENGLLHFR